MKKKLFLIAGITLSVLMGASCKKDNDPDTDQFEKKDTRPSYTVSNQVNPFTWIAIDGQGNKIDPDNSGYKDASSRSKKQVAMFYFLWHGCHGYDQPANYNQVVPPTASDTQSPYDIQKLLDENPSNPALGGFTVMHHWGEPMLGYYVANDDWVIRKHAQMLEDAGVDVIFFDVTNGYHYLPVVKNLCEVYMQMREEGCDTPQFAFLANYNPGGMVNTLYNEIYAKGLYQDLWYYWNGKPLMLADKSAVTDATQLNFFEFRHSWFTWNQDAADSWFGTGEDQWPWGGWYPQKIGMHNGTKESISVMPATHPSSNIGRSYDAKTSTQPKTTNSGKGIYFKTQFNYALQNDPTLLFFTGWNEWTAQKQSGSYNFLGHQQDWYFVDQYNHEFSRDIEPLNGDFGDNYYYLLCDFVRKFKGTLKLPTFSTTDAISIDGSFSDWDKAAAIYADYKGDVTHRNHFGWGRIGTYTNNTGRNDFVTCKVANDGTNVYFYAQTNKDITDITDAQWMQLFLHVDGTTAWESFDFAINRTSPSKTEAVLEKSEGGWKWSKVSNVKYSVNGNQIEIAVPLKDLGISDSDEFTVDFKWIDNAAGDGDIQTCMRDGDSAPDGRFRYRYKFKKA